MGINLSKEQWFRLAEARKYLPTHPSYNTVKRWCLQGHKGLDGQRIYLERVRISSGWVTSVEAYIRFQTKIARSYCSVGLRPPAKDQTLLKSPISAISQSAAG